jgi:DNA-binding MarR family transcriptional regulator
LVLDFINGHPGHDLTAGTIARELGRSPGAVANNLDHLIREGLVTSVDPDGRTVTALSTATANSAA